MFDIIFAFLPCPGIYRGTPAFRRGHWVNSFCSGSREIQPNPMKFIDSDTTFPISSAVVHSGNVFEAVVTGIPDGAPRPVEGGAGAEMREAFRQLDLLLAEAGLDRYSICTARLYLQDVRGEIAAVNVVWKEYFGDHPVCRRAYGVELQAGMRLEAAFTAEVP